MEHTDKKHFQAAILTDTYRSLRFEACDLNNMDLRAFDLSGMTFYKSSMCSCMLAGCDLSGADLRYVRFYHADLHDARLVGAQLVGSDLSRVDLYGTDLRWANLLNCIITLDGLRDCVLGWTILPDGSIK